MCGGGGQGGGLLIPTRLRSRVRINRHSKIKETRISGTELIGELPQKWTFKPEDHWSCVAHLSADDMLKSTIIEEKKFKHSPCRGRQPIRAKILMLTGRTHHYGHLLQV